ncbi:MAG: hypothetical protein HY815_13530 [Candidatus Riflebacteria bacterium]|nr:hypothetical protein [Candidatus Riflebacteria bacterium]
MRSFRPVVHGAVAIVVALGAASPALAKKGDLVPIAGGGVEVVSVKGQKVAEAVIGGLKVHVRVTSKAGFVYLDVGIVNQSGRTAKVEPDQVVLKSRGEEVDCLDPDTYIRIAYETTTPYPVDDQGNIVQDDKGVLPVKAYTPGDSTKGSLAEMMADQEWDPESPSERMRITKELLSLKKDLLTVGGDVAPGKSRRGRKVFQRTWVDPPIVVSFKHPVGRMTVRFERER